MNEIVISGKGKLVFGLTTQRKLILSTRPNISLKSSAETTNTISLELKMFYNKKVIHILINRIQKLHKIQTYKWKLFYKSLEVCQNIKI